jgi:hypothetical protein
VTDYRVFFTQDGNATYDHVDVSSTRPPHNIADDAWWKCVDEHGVPGVWINMQHVSMIVVKIVTDEDPE